MTNANVLAWSLVQPVEATEAVAAPAYRAPWIPEEAAALPRLDLGALVDAPGGEPRLGPTAAALIGAQYHARGGEVGAIERVFVGRAGSAPAPAVPFRLDLLLRLDDGEVVLASERGVWAPGPRGGHVVRPLGDALVAAVGAALRPLEGWDAEVALRPGAIGREVALAPGVAVVLDDVVERVSERLVVPGCVRRLVVDVALRPKRLLAPAWPGAWIDDATGAHHALRAGAPLVLPIEIVGGP